MRLIIKRKLSHFRLVQDSRGDTAIVADPPSVFPSPALHIAYDLGNNPFPRIIAGSKTHGLALFVTVGVREEGKLQRCFRGRHVRVRLAQIQHVGAPTLRGQGLLNRSRITRQNFRTSRVILE